MKECDNCENKSQVTYYCEFCEKSFCNACTVEEAHATNPDKSNQLTECKFIHLQVWSNLNMDCVVHAFLGPLSSRL